MSFGSSSYDPELLLLNPLLREYERLGRKMMLVMVSGFHSRRKLPLTLELLPRLLLLLSLNLPLVALKSSLDDSL